MDYLYFIMALYFINFFFGLKLLLNNNLNFANMFYTLILIIILPIFTPLIFLFTYLDERIRKKFIKKRTYDISNIPQLKEQETTQHNSLELFTNGELLFENIFEEIEHAQHFIHISFFTFNTDKIGKLFISKLEQKLKQNVNVMILYDPLGSYTMRKKHFKNFLKLGGELVSFVNFKNHFLNLNYRNHRKVLIIDNKICYIGGFNIGDKYLGRNKKLGLWIDSELKITGRAVNTIEKRFLADYMYCTRKKIDINQFLLEHQFDDHKQVEIITSGVDINDLNLIENKLIHLIYNAEKYIYLQTPYLILNDCIIKALKYAANKGVEIKIMLPNKNDHPFVLQATKAYASLLTDKNITIYLFNKNAFLHSKVFISDDHYSSVGTTNLDIRSFKYSLEINAFINDITFAEYLKKIYLKQITYCTVYTNKKNKLSESLCKLLSTIL